jgi:uncharacterized membrane protein
MKPVRCRRLYAFVTRFTWLPAYRKRKNRVRKIINLGQLIFGTTVAALGLENLICTHFRLTNPGVPWFPANPFWGYLNGIVLIAAGLSIAAALHSRMAATLLGYLFSLYVLFLQMPLVIAHPADWSVYGVLCEALALGGSAWTLVRTLPKISLREGVLSKVTVSGPYLFAASLIVFGGIHFFEARFIASLIPAWIPGALFFTYLIGAAFIAAAISIVFQRLDQWAGFLLGVMFLLFVVLLHSRRVAADPHNPDEWSSALIALGMCGGSWIVARNAHRRQQPDASS